MMTSSQRADGYKFIREKGPRCNNGNQFMEWTDEKIHVEGSKIYGWQEGKVKGTLSNYAKGRQNAKMFTFWVLALKDSHGLFLYDVLKAMLGPLRQHGITWIGKSRVRKSAGSKTVAFVQSALEISMLERETNDALLEMSFITVKNLDFFKS